MSVIAGFGGITLLSEVVKPAPVRAAVVCYGTVRLPSHAGRNDYLRLRSAPGSDYNIRRLYEGQEVTIHSESYARGEKWYSVSSPAGDGYVQTRYIKKFCKETNPGRGDNCDDNNGGGFGLHGGSGCKDKDNGGSNGGGFGLH